MQRSFVTELSIALPADRVRAWWTDIDPATIVARDGDITHIHAKFGTFAVTETFRVRSDGSWTFHTRAPFGIDVRDSFEARPEGAGTRLRIECALSARNILGRVSLPFYAPIGRAQFRKQWNEMARQCEKDEARA